MKLRADRLLIQCQCLLLSGMIVTQAWGSMTLASGLFTLTFVLTLGLWLVTAWGGIGETNLLAVLILITSCIAVSANALMSGTVISLSYIKKLVMFWTTILCFGAMRAYRPEERDIRFIFRWNTLMVCFLGGMYALQNRQMYLLNGRVSAYLTFRFTNPNLAAVFLAAICMIEVIHAAATPGPMARCTHIFLACVMGYFVYQTQARNARLLLLVFVIFPQLIPRRKRRFRGGMAALFALFPLLFAMSYLLLVETPLARSLFSFLAGEGKGLDSRVEIWRFALESFVASPVFGAYSQISGGTGTSQMHNSHLDILASYGGPVFLLVCIFLYLVLRDNRSRKADSVRFLCSTGFAALMLSGLGEAMLFSGGMGVYLYAGLLRLLANFEYERDCGAGENRVCEQLHEPPPAASF